MTTGLLIGIGETWEERVDSLLQIRDLHVSHGHIQEVIIQNFRAKAGTRMAFAPEPDEEEFLRSIALARIILGPDISVQAPPNLAHGDLGRLISAGINDWGGVSPVTPDHVNPEAPWPHLDRLSSASAAAGKELVQRLTVYPRYIDLNLRDDWIDAKVFRHVLARADAEGLARECDWLAGGMVPPDTRQFEAWTSRSIRPPSAPKSAISSKRRCPAGGWTRRRSGSCSACAAATCCMSARPPMRCARTYAGAK
jgi:FO synthase